MAFSFPANKILHSRKEERRRCLQILQAEVKQQLGLDIGSAGDMDTGNKFHRFSTDAAREVLANLVTDESAREPFKEIHLRLCAIVRVMNSQQREINVPLYRELCTSVYLKLVQCFKWAVISPSLHRVMGIDRSK